MTALFLALVMPDALHGRDGQTPDETRGTPERQPLEQLIDLRRELFQERREVEEGFAHLAPEERRARFQEWRLQNADLFDAIRELAIELTAPARKPMEIPEEEWQRRTADLPPDLGAFMEARREFSSRLGESMRPGAELSATERDELSEKRSRLQELARNLTSARRPELRAVPDLVLPDGLPPELAAALQLRRELALERRQLEHDSTNATVEERTRALQNGGKKPPPAMNSSAICVKNQKRNINVNRCLLAIKPSFYIHIHPCLLPFSFQNPTHNE